jgi:amino acid transporter
MNISVDAERKSRNILYSVQQLFVSLFAVFIAILGYMSDPGKQAVHREGPLYILALLLSVLLLLLFLLLFAELSVILHVVHVC